MEDTAKLTKGEYIFHQGEAAPNKPLKQKTNEEKIELIINLVAKDCDVTRGQVIGKYRFKEIVKARHLAMWFIKEYNLKPTLTSIGEIFSERDHSTVIHAIEAVDDLKETDKKYRHFFTLLKHKIEIQIL